MTNVKGCLKTKRAELYLYRALFLMKVADSLTGFIRIRILKRAVILLQKGIVIAHKADTNEKNEKLLQELYWHLENLCCFKYSDKES